MVALGRSRELVHADRRAFRHRSCANEEPPASLPITPTHRQLPSRIVQPFAGALLGSGASAHARNRHRTDHSPDPGRGGRAVANHWDSSRSQQTPLCRFERGVCRMRPNRSRARRSPAMAYNSEPFRAGAKRGSRGTCGSADDDPESVTVSFQVATWRRVRSRASLRVGCPGYRCEPAPCWRRSSCQGARLGALSRSLPI